MEEKYDVPVLALDVLNLTVQDINSILSSVLFEFPLTEIRIDTPKWVQTLDEEHWLVKYILEYVNNIIDNVYRVRDVERIGIADEQMEYIEWPKISSINLGTGKWPSVLM